MNIIERFNAIDVIQIGCGGTGSWVVPLVSKLLNNIKLRTNHCNIFYKLIDNDVVESRNILRQNFNDWDISKSKCRSLVSKYVYNFSDLTFYPQQITTKRDFERLQAERLTDMDGEIRSLVIVLGCVDNNKTRCLIYKAIKSHSKKYANKRVYFYIDSGNMLYNGQIITLPFGLQGEDQASLVNFKKQKKLDFLKMFDPKDSQETEQSCAFFGDQSQAINSLAATLMFCCLQKILVASELPPQIISFNSSGYSTFEV